RGQGFDPPRLHHCDDFECRCARWPTRFRPPALLAFGVREAMFDTLSDRLTGVFDRLRGRGALNEGDVREAMREVRVALLEADVALPVAREFIDKVTEKAVGQQVLRSVTPGQQVVKIVN